MPEETIPEGGEEKGKEAGGEKEQEWSNLQLARGIAFMMQKQNELVQRIGAYDQRMNTLESGTTPPGKVEEEAATPKGKDPEEMGREEYADFVADRAVSRVMEKAVKPFQQDEEDRDRARFERDAETAVKGAQDKYEDFKYWEPELSKLVEAHPNMSLDDAIVLARAKDPGKVKQIAEATEKKSSSEKPEAEEAEQGFGGLLPTSSVGPNKQDMEFTEAGDVAWDKEMGQFMSLLSSN